MKISIITPVYNSATIIEKNVNSIITQNYRNFEHIIIDNLSSDATLKIIKNIYSENKLTNKLRIISEKDEGIADAFNKGITTAAGEVIAILNSDDVYFNNQVFETIEDIFKDPEILFVHGDIYFDDPVYGSNIRKPLLCPITTAMPYNHPSMFIRKEIYEKYGSYDVSYKYAMDYEFIIRLEMVFPGFKGRGRYYTEQPVAIMYSGGASWNNELRSIEESKAALKKYGFWNSAAQKNYLLRVIRTYFKKYLNGLNLSGVVKYWRYKKWKN